MKSHTWESVSARKYTMQILEVKEKSSKKEVYKKTEREGMIPVEINSLLKYFNM